MALLRRVLGDTLRGQRMRQRRTLREVAGTARVSLGYLSEIERGQKEASSELLESICAALGVRLSDLLREVSDSMHHAEEPAAAPALAPAAPVPVLPRRESTGAGRRPAIAPVSRRPVAGRESDLLERAARENATREPAPIGPKPATVPAPPASSSVPPVSRALPSSTVSEAGLDRALFARVGAHSGDGQGSDTAATAALFPRVGELPTRPEPLRRADDQHGAWEARCSVVSAA